MTFISTINNRPEKRFKSADKNPNLPTDILSIVFRILLQDRLNSLSDFKNVLLVNKEWAILVSKPYYLIEVLQKISANLWPAAKNSSLLCEYYQKMSKEKPTAASWFIARQFFFKYLETSPKEIISGIINKERLTLQSSFLSTPLCHPMIAEKIDILVQTQNFEAAFAYKDLNVKPSEIENYYYQFELALYAALFKYHGIQKALSIIREISDAATFPKEFDAFIKYGCQIYLLCWNVSTRNIFNYDDHSKIIQLRIEFLNILKSFVKIADGHLSYRLQNVPNAIDSLMETAILLLFGAKEDLYDNDLQVFFSIIPPNFKGFKFNIAPCSTYFTHALMNIGSYNKEKFIQKMNKIPNVNIKHYLLVNVIKEYFYCAHSLMLARWEAAHNIENKIIENSLLATKALCHKLFEENTYLFTSIVISPEEVLKLNCLKFQECFLSLLRKKLRVLEKIDIHSREGSRIFECIGKFLINKNEILLAKKAENIKNELLNKETPEQRFAEVFNTSEEVYKTQDIDIDINFQFHYFE